MLLRADKISKRFGRSLIFSDVSLQLEASSVSLLIGANGAGKSTLLGILSGLTRPTEGRVFLANEPLEMGDISQRKRIGLMTHQPMLYGELSARENLRFFADLYGLENGSDIVAEMIRGFQLERFAEQPVAELSRGTQQRVSFGRALLQDPDVIFVDEPFAGLDQHHASLVADVLWTLRNKGKAVLVVSHQLESLGERWDQLFKLEAGRLLSEKRILA